MHSLLVKKIVTACAGISIVSQSSLSPAFSQDSAGDPAPDFAAVNKMIDEGALLPARARVEVLIKKYPDDWRLSLLAGGLFRRMGLTGVAITQYENVRAHDPPKKYLVEALIALSELRLQNLDTESALTLARRAVELDGESKSGRVALVNALVSGQYLRQAREQAQKLTVMYPDDADVIHTLSSVEQAFGQYDLAATLLQSALFRRPQNIAWRLELADLYISRDKYDDARRELKQVLTLDPHSLDGLTNMAHLQEFSLHEYMGAVATYHAILDIIPDSASAQAGIDRCLEKQGDFALSLRDAFYHLFGLQMRQKKIEEGVDDLESPSSI